MRRPSAGWITEWTFEADRVRLALGARPRFGDSTLGLLDALERMLAYPSAQFESSDGRWAGLGREPGEVSEAYETRAHESLDETRTVHRIGLISAYYGAFGFESCPNELVDHVSVELDFLGFLCVKEACAREDGEEDVVAVCREMQRRFLSEHLGKWSPTFCARVHATCADGFLSTAATLLAAWLEAETRYFVSDFRCLIPVRHGRVLPVRGIASGEESDGLLDHAFAACGAEAPLGV